MTRKSHQYAGDAFIAVKRSAVQLAGGLALACASLTAFAAVEFQDVTKRAGMDGEGESWGASWGDINNDNWPDLFNQGHREYPRLYRNTGERSFEDIAYEADNGFWISNPNDDKHGAVFNDFDNDGDEDLQVSLSGGNTSGGGAPAQLLVNSNGKGNLVNRALAADIAEDERARMGVFHDINNDGFLDLMQVHNSGAFLRQRDPDDPVRPLFDFDDITSAARLQCEDKLNYGQLIDINGDGRLELMCLREGVFPLGVFDTTTFPLTNIAGSVPTVSNTNDSAVADFDNNGEQDIVFTRGAARPSYATQVGDFRVEAWLRKSSTVPPGKGFSFASNGPITVTISYAGQKLEAPGEVYNLSPSGTRSFTVTTTDSDGSLLFTWSQQTNRWVVTLTEDTQAFQAYLQIDTTAPVSDVEVFNLDNPEVAYAPTLLLNNGGTLRQRTGRGLDEPVFCGSVVAGDFDNDMDQDLYMVCRRGPTNFRNRYYDNDGNGNFTEVENFGAVGPVGTSFDKGVGESVAMADYDVNGFLDLYVTNGLLFLPFGEGGPEKLYRNRGNDNHWLQMDLQGTRSNRDGLGAKVFVTAGGVTQMREQNGGYHRWSQNHQRIHFGLADNTSARVRIEWPSGEVDTYNNVQADRLYDAVEGTRLSRATLGPSTFTELKAGDECGAPSYNDDYGPAVLIWRNCPKNTWFIRVRGGRAEEQTWFEGQIRADKDFGNLTRVNLDGDDTAFIRQGKEVRFNLFSWFNSNKGINIATAGQTSACLSIDRNQFQAVVVGSKEKVITGDFDLKTLQPCFGPPSLTKQNVCGAPKINASQEKGLFLWKDCANSTNSNAIWNARVTAGGQAQQAFRGVIDSNRVINGTRVLLESNDVLDSNPNDTNMNFVFRVGGAARDGFRTQIPSNSRSCLEIGNLPNNTKVAFGNGKIEVNGDIDLASLEYCGLQ